MIVAWSSDEVEKVKPTPITVMLSRNIMSQGHLMRCIRCGLPIVELVNQVLMIIGDGGIPLPELVSYDVVSMQAIQCRRCKTEYRIFV